MQKGMVHVYYGNGKGKSTSTIGIIIRALGHDLKIALVKFFKTENISGEDKILKKYNNLKIIFSKYLYPYKKQSDDDYIKYKERSFNEQKILLQRSIGLLNKDYDIIILDEVLDLIPDKIIETEDIISLIKNKKKNTELVLTGHYINRKIKRNADLITKMMKIKHYYDKKTICRFGIEK